MPDYHPNSETAIPALNLTVPVLLTPDIEAAIAYYCQVLGFAHVFTYQETYAGVCRDGVVIHLGLLGPHPPASNNRCWSEETAYPADINFFVRGVDALYEQFKQRGASIPAPPRDQPYGIRSFDVIDLNGYVLRFNQEIGEEG